jgi:hypothetical protein
MEFLFGKWSYYFRLVLEQNNPSNQLDICNLSSGLLFVKIKIDNGSLTKKVIKD